MKISVSGGLGLLLVWSPVLATQPEPEGEQFQVNSYVTGYQWNPSVAADPQGNFLVVWASDGSYGIDNDGYSIQGQRYDASGTPVGGQFEVNTFIMRSQETPAVATDPDGDFVVVWGSNGSPGTDSSRGSVQGQRFDASGAPVGTQFQVNSYTTENQRLPAIAIDSHGDFVVVWVSDGSSGTDTSASSIQGQRFDEGGTPLGGEFQVNTYTTGSQWYPSIAVDADSDFVVVWQSPGSYGSDSDGSSIQGQRFDASGSPAGGQFQVNSYTTNWQYSPVAATDASGNFVVLWGSDGSSGSDTDSWSVQGQRYDSAGSPVGAQFQLNSYTTGSQGWPSVEMMPDGRFTVSWNSDEIKARSFEADATPSGGEFQINTYTTDYQGDSSVSIDSNGNFIVVWQSMGSSGTDTDLSSIQGQRFSAGAIFADGFESGDTSAWSSTVP